MTTWFSDVVAVYGRPTHWSDSPLLQSDEGGEFTTRFWEWENHSVIICKYYVQPKGGGESTYWVVEIRSHTSKTSVEWSTPVEPDDELMRSLLELTGFLRTPAVSS